MLKIVSWNIARRDECWQLLLDSDYDVAVLQEAHQPPSDIAERIRISPGGWHTAGSGVHRPWRAAIAILNPSIQVDWIEAKSIDEADPREFAVSRLGTLSAAQVSWEQGEPLTIASAYAAWESPLKELGGNWIYADASAHRVISDLAMLVASQRGHRLVVAGDWNALRGYGEGGSPYWRERYKTIFDRMKAIGLPFAGPEAPNGRQAVPWPDELPKNSLCVPTFHTTHMTPATAERQLDFVFASQDMQLSVNALNRVEDWGPSDHCRIVVDVK
jgi:exonuclease III